MEYLKELFDFFRTAIAVLIEIWSELLFKIAGTLFPFYIGAFILFFLEPESLNKVFDPQSFILYAATFLFSSMYIWYTVVNTKNKNGLIFFLFFLLLAITVSFLYAFSLTDSLESKRDFKNWSYYLFGICMLMYVIFECISYFKTNNKTFKEESENQFDSFKESFNKIKEDGE